jgi:hypothetical protein
MSATSAPFGLRPVYHPSGLDRAREYSMLAAYATPIYKGSPVALVSNRINIASFQADWLGSFAGCEYVDVNGKPNVSNYWPGALTGATNITAWVYDDPMQVFEIQANGSIAATAQGAQIDFDSGSIASGSTSTGLSSAMAASAIVSAGVQAQLRILDRNQSPSNAWGDAFTVLQVQNARHQFVSNKVSV